MVDIFATRFNPPFAVTASDAMWLIDSFNGDMLETLGKQAQFRNLGVMVVDLTHRGRMSGQGFITSGGWNRKEFRNAASLVKIAAMHAALTLKDNLAIALNETSATTASEAVAEVTADWKESVETAVPGGRPDFPQIANIFTVTGGAGSWTLTFTRDFMNHMEEMIGHSNNHSASVCIDRLGFQFINGALAAEGLYDSTSGGLWLGGNYAGRNWMPEPRTKLTHMGATAEAVAKFLSLLEDDRLVSADASAEMRRIMALAGTWFQEGLSRAKPRRAVNSAYAKVGIYGGRYHDCAVLERTSKEGRAIRYAAVVLGASDPQIIRNIAVKLDDYVLASN
jgi:Beta-lactamase enzyme family